MTTALPLDIGTLHFVGIGGIGMSGIAETLQALGYRVQGSDVAESGNVLRLRAKGIPVSIGHRPENLGDAQVLIYSSAVTADNPELTTARARGIPVVRRAEMLAELMRLKWSIAIGGTHGKTTTTSLIAALLDSAGLDPTVINGGIINAYGTNARLGRGDWMVVEADESDGTFMRLPATIAVVTNIDPEHLDHYGSFEAVKAAFHTFASNIPFYGVAVLCADHPEVAALAARLQDRRVITYGFAADAEVRGHIDARGAEGARFTVTIATAGTRRTIADLRLPMHGVHNVQNALAAVAVAQAMELPDDVLRRALSGFAGVKRRFTKTGEAGGVTVIDDYGHHPVEIAAVLQAARGVTRGRVIAVVQPHRYTRLQSLFDAFSACFAEADTVLVAEVYAAGEAPLPGVSRDALVAAIRAQGHADARPLADPKALAATVATIARPGDLVVCLGAGSITQWAQALPGELAALAPRAAAGGRA